MAPTLQELQDFAARFQDLSCSPDHRLASYDYLAVASTTTVTLVTHALLYRPGLRFKLMCRCLAVVLRDVAGSSRSLEGGGYNVDETYGLIGPDDELQQLLVAKNDHAGRLRDLTALLLFHAGRSTIELVAHLCCCGLRQEIQWDMVKGTASPKTHSKSRLIPTEVIWVFGDVDAVKLLVLAHLTEDEKLNIVTRRDGERLVDPFHLNVAVACELYVPDWVTEVYSDWSD